MVCRFFQNVDTVHGDAAGARDGSDEFGYEEESRGVDESTADDEKINWRGRIRESVLDLFQRTMFKTNILHCIYRFYNSDRMESDVHRRIQGVPSSFPHTNLFIIASHGDHLHVLHDCSWTGSTCRCACVKNFERLFGAYAYRAKRWVIRKFKWNAERAVNTLFYLAKGRRQIEHCQFGRFLVRPGDRPSHKSRYSALFDWLQNRQKGLVAGDHFPVDNNLLEEFGIGRSCRPSTSSDHDAHGTQTGGNQHQGRVKGSQEKHRGQRILRWFRTFPTAPVNSILQTRHWAESEFGMIHRGDKLLATVLNSCALEICDMSMTDLFQRYSSLEFNNLIFAAPMGNVEDTYYDIEESVRVLEELLLFQFDNDVEIVQVFLADLVDVLDKKRQKLNTFFVLGASNAGKNFFFDCVIHYFLNFGMIGNFSKYVGFPLQDCVSRRILLWNEPNAEASAFETLKMLLGGDQCVVRVKFQSDVTVGRTPVIVLSNTDIFPKTDAFRNRIIRYEWQKAPYLAEKLKRPHPLGFYKLILKYNLFK
uniref:Non-capsid protein NS-1 n=1 Tax=Cacopsylla melanoneura TaxID=428564 RepID=A0A8D8WBT3_9HEMI